MIKRRIMPEDVIINCSKDSKIPKPPDGHKWKKVQHDNSVTWLASWTENIQGQIKYIMLNPSSRLKGEKDWQKYEKARKLKDKIDQIREDYMQVYFPFFMPDQIYTKAQRLPECTPKLKFLQETFFFVISNDTNEVL